MTDINPPGEYTNGWTKAIISNPNFKCRKCGSIHISFKDWESSCGGYEDTHYRCDDCNYDWWVESSDS
jgi:transposase-like protein